MVKRRNRKNKQKSRHTQTSSTFSRAWRLFEIIFALGVILIVVFVVSQSENLDYLIDGVLKLYEQSPREVKGEIVNGVMGLIALLLVLADPVKDFLFEVLYTILRALGLPIRTRSVADNSFPPVQALMLTLVYLLFSLLIVFNYYQTNPT